MEEAILNSKRLGSYIKEARLKKSLLQKDVAYIVGCSAQFLGQIEKEEVPIPVETLVSLIKTLKLSERKLVSIYKQNYEEKARAIYKKASGD